VLDNYPAVSPSPKKGRARWHQQMLARLVYLEEEERKRLARQIHDGVLQDLGLCYLRAELCERWGAAGDADRAQREAAELREGLDRAVKALRAIMVGLRLPAMEDDAGNQLASFCDLVAIGHRPPVKLESPVPNIRDRALRLFFTRLLQSALQSAASCPTISEVGLSFQELSDVVETIIEYRCLSSPSQVTNLTKELDLHWLDAVRLKVEIGGGFSRVDELPAGMRLLFVVPTAEPSH